MVFSTLFKKFTFSKPYIIAALIFCCSALAVFAAQELIRIQTESSLSLYPRPKFDTGIGIHWDASAQSNDSTSAQNNLCTLKSMGISWIKVAVNADSTVDFVQTMKKNDIEPIIRLSRPKINPGRLSPVDLESAAEYIAAGARYFEINNEPNLKDEWTNFQLPCEKTAATTMESWTKDAVAIQQMGGFPLFPGLAPTEDSDVSCEDATFVRNSFSWLKDNQCTLANNTTGSCLELFNPEKSNNRPAVMNVHNYSLSNDENGDISGNEGFGLFRKYHEIINEFLGKKIPILATEGGPTIADNSAPNNNSNSHKAIALASAQFQMDNKDPYFFTTAFWVSHHTGSAVDPGAKDQAWFSWEQGNRLKPQNKFSQTINALTQMPKKSRNGATQPSPSNCNPNTTTPSPTKNPSPSTITPTPITSCQAQSPKITPNPMECVPEIEQDFSQSKLVNGSFDNDDPYNGWTTFGDADFEVESGSEKFGIHGLLFQANGNFTAGVYQTVDNLTPGKWYHAFYATAQEVWGNSSLPNKGKDGSLPILRSVGIDPQGGTDVSASSIIWGRTIGGQPDKDAKRYGGWKTLGAGNAPLVSFKATGKSATFFIKATGWPDVIRSKTWIDSAFLSEICDEGNFDAAPAPSCQPQTTQPPTPKNPVLSPTQTPTPAPAQIGSCSVTLTGIDTSKTDSTTVRLSLTGVGGTVDLVMGQQGEKGKESGNQYSIDGFFSPNYAQGFSDTDSKNAENLPKDPLTGGTIPVESNTILVGKTKTTLENTFFKTYQWESKFKKNQFIATNSSNPLDFILAKKTAYWYYIDSCNGTTTQCALPNILVQLPKNKNAHFFCTVRNQSSSYDTLVCNGNPVCEYNNGPDVGISPTVACNAWKKSCSQNDFVSFQDGARGSGLELQSFQP